MAADRRLQGARRATVLRYGGSLWVNGYWLDTTVSVELRPVQRSNRRLMLVGPPFGPGRSIAVDLGADASIEVLANERADWIGAPSLSVHSAERTWPAIAQRLAAALAGERLEEVSA